jgi:hypothetical protein
MGGGRDCSRLSGLVDRLPGWGPLTGGGGVGPGPEGALRGEDLLGLELLEEEFVGGAGGQRAGIVSLWIERKIE